MDAEGCVLASDEMIKQTQEDAIPDDRGQTNNNDFKEEINQAMNSSEETIEQPQEKKVIHDKVQNNSENLQEEANQTASSKDEMRVTLMIDLHLGAEQTQVAKVQAFVMYCVQWE